MIASGFVEHMQEQGSVILEGYLKKRGRINTDWKERYFKLYPHKIEYYTDKYGHMCGCLRLDDKLVRAYLPISSSSAASASASASSSSSSSSSSSLKMLTKGF